MFHQSGCWIVCTGHARTQGSQWITLWLLALDDSLGMTSLLFRLLLEFLVSRTGEV